MYLRYCTFTGVDAWTDLDQLISLSHAYPFVEWGFLYSPTRAGGDNRYMTVKQIRDSSRYLNTKCNLSLHLCGKGVNEFLSNKLPFSVHPFKRIQLNFNIKNVEWSLSSLVDTIREYKCQQLITQDNEHNVDVWRYLFNEPNYAILWDASGGTGKEIESVQLRYPGIFSGFAGGLTPENVHQKCSLIASLHPNLVTWIDMESGVRTMDRFDLEKIKQVLDIVKLWA